MMRDRNLSFTLGLVLVFCAGAGTGALWMERQALRAEEPAAEKAARPAGTPFGPMLVRGLRASPGCLKVDSAKTFSGKHVIFGWFEDKEAAQRWYYSDTHQKMLDEFRPHRNRDRVPLGFVPDDVGPLMVIAALSLPEPGTEGFPQISIEIYAPLHGGFAHGGLFGPDHFKELYMHYEHFWPEGAEIPPEYQEKIRREKEMWKKLHGEDS